MAESTYSRKLDAMGRIMIPVRLRDQLGLVPGREYTFEVRTFNDHNYICIDCGMNTELEEAMKLVKKAGLKIVQNDD
jgi:bifunctional DNA-binding transcriptional regulator/antitoxin component of YhaV-PrlF toxin-antitoxin module